MWDAWSRHCVMCPGRVTRAHPSIWEPRPACACSSECAPCPWLHPGSHEALPTPLGQADPGTDGPQGEALTATAFCSLSHPEAAAQVLAAVSQVLARFPFDFRGARILSGQDEGVFGWVTANYLLENFIKVGGRQAADLGSPRATWAPALADPAALSLAVRLGGPLVPAPEGDAGGPGPGRGLHTDHVRDGGPGGGPCW